MPFYLFKSQIWKYKFQKLAFTVDAVLSYLGIYTWVLLEKIKSPKTTFIGVLLAEHLGDIVAAEPIIEALQKKFPNARICWIAKKHFHVLLENHPGIFKVLEEKNIYSSALLTRKNPFDYFYNLHVSGTRPQPFYEPMFNNPKSQLLNITSENYFLNQNLLDVYSRLADVAVKNDQPKIYTNTTNIHFPFEGPYWVIHTKSNQRKKEWKDEKWEELINLILNQFPVHIIEIGISDPVLCDHPNFHSMVGKLTIKESISLIQNATFFIGIDSGPSHIANALQIPALLILGKYENFETYMPFSGAYRDGKIAKVYFNKLQTAAEHSVEEIWEALEKTYLKQPALV